jgi:hypothetical protein
MTALHKADRATQAANAAAGKEDPLRAINSGSTFLKQGLKCMTAHKSFQPVKQRIGICQYGLGYRGGPECMCHVARSHVAMGFAVNTQDAIKGFHMLERQAVLDGINAEWPEANKQFTTYYGPAAPCIYKFNDAEGNPIYRVSWSTQGTRAGCVLGSAGFDIALHHFVYKKLASELEDNVVKALTDDMPSFFRPPSLIPTDDE